MMQRYHATSAVNNNSAISGIQTRDTSSRADSSSAPPNFSLNSRRSSKVASYELRCEKEQLNPRLGPPDFHPQSPDCPEETLIREYAQSGYRDTVEGLEESREISLSQVQAFAKLPTFKYKEAIRKCHRAINESRAQKRKAGQVYGVPLSGTLLTKSGVFPDQRTCGEDSRRKWIEGLSQPHKRLRSLADQVPHGYRRNSLFEVLIRNNVPLLRATWFIKVTYLNQVRASTSSSSSGFHEKSQFARSEQWTRDVIEYLKYLLDEFISRSNSHSTFHIRDRPTSQMVYNASVHQKGNPVSPFTDGEEPTLYTKWWYMVRIIHWHHAEGLLIPSLIIDWVLNQLQEKELLGVLQLLLPIIYGVIETVILSQTYVRTLVGIGVRFSQEPSSPGGSDLVDNSRRAYTTSAVVEMLRYLILAVPDTFVALDCFPLPKCVTSFVVNDGSFLAKTVRDGSQMEVSGTIRDKVHAESLSFLSVVTSIQSRAETLSRAARPNHPRHNVATALQALDQALIHGDIQHAYNLLWENLWNGTCTNQWIAEISPCLFTSLKQISKVTSSVICSVFLICEWATCEFRDFRNAPPHGLKFTGRKDFSQIFIAIRLLKLKMSNMQNPNRKKQDIFEGRGPLHDVIVCWIDQHEVHNTEGFNRLQLLVRELIQSGIFIPHAYVRQLIVSGIMDGNRPVIELERRRRHYKLLKKLTAPYVSDLLREGQIGEPQALDSSANIYSNERRVILHGLSGPGISAPHIGNDFKLKQLKALISSHLQLPMDPGVDESGGINSRTDTVEDTSGCDECRVAKRQKVNEHNLNATEEEESWWDNKALLKCAESFKPEPPPLKPPIKQASRGRQKSVRKTQSLAQLAAARIEGSQGASTSHMCESKVGCPNHRSGFDSAVKTVDGKRKLPTGDIVSIGEFLKKLGFAEKRSVTQWLISFVKKVIEEGEKTPSKAGQARQYPAVDDRSSLQWRLGEDELSAILFLLDICKEFVSAVRFLLWLLQKVPGNPVSAVHNRNILNVTRATENHTFDVGDTFLLSCFRRYENIVVAADFIPDILSALMHRTTAVLASSGRLSSSPAFIYGRHLLKKYSSVSSVVEWEKTFKLTCDKRLGSELESSGRSLEGFSLGAPNGVEDLDDYFRQKISSVRPSRVALSMKEIVHRHVDEAFQYFYSKDRKTTFGSGISKTASIDKREDGFQIAYQIVTGLMDCMRQTGGAAQEGDPALVSSAIAAIVHNVGQVIARIPDLTASSNNYSNAPLPSSSLHFARRILRIHVTCLCILKEALGERQSHVFEVALASEASSALLQGFSPGKAYSNTNNDVNKPVHGKLARITSAVSALVIGTILQGVTSLERMVSLLRIKEGIDLVQFVRSMKSNVNGNARSVGVVKMDNLIEVSVNWFRVLVGNCRTVCDGFIVELLGETSIVALLRMQRVLPPKLVFPPAYSIFALVVWRPILESSFGVREDIHQLSTVAISDAIKHLPFRETCLRDTHGLYDLISADSLDSEFLTLLESTSSGINLKAAALVPLRARLFLDSLLDCKISPVKIDEGKLVNGQVELKKRCAENVKRLAGKLVNVLDTMQPARFHWQWLELRLLLNEQAVNEKMMENDISLAEAVRSVSSSNHAASEYESHFVQIILTRLLVRPDAAPLFAEIVHLLGKSLEDSMLSQAKWLLRGAEVLYGKKSIRQKVLNIAADLKEPSLKSQYWKPWGWCRFESKKMEKVKSDLEEGEVEEGHFGKGSGLLDVEGFIVSQQHVTERALIELILPCVDRGSDELRNNFASEMIKQMSNIEQQINSVTRGVSKPVLTPTPATGGPPTKSRKGGKSGSPGIISRQSTVSTETVPPSPAALRASMTLRLHILLRLLPIICADREPSGRNMRYTLASVILRLLGSRVVHEDPTHFVNPALISSKREVEPSVENLTANALLCGENLFDCFLLVLHVLLSNHQPSWLKSRSESKSIENHRSYVVFDREVAESLQNELERMDLPDAIRWRIQTAMPILFPSARRSISCQPESTSAAALSCLQPSTPVITLNPKNTNPPQRNPLLPGRVISSLKTKPSPVAQQQDMETENDPWTLLEEGAGSSLTQPNLAGVSGSDPANLKASNFLKGAVRVRRTDLSYIGTVDEDS